VVLLPPVHGAPPEQSAKAKTTIFGQDAEVLRQQLGGSAAGVVASTYGYDVRQPEEELFALGVLSLASANTLSGKAAAMASLSRLAQQMMRRATWAQLQNHLLVSVIDRVYAALGGTLTRALPTRRSAGRRRSTACASCRRSMASTPTSGAAMPQSGPMRPRTSFRSTRNSRLRSNASRVANRCRPLAQQRQGPRDGYLRKLPAGPRSPRSTRAPTRSSAWSWPASC